ncbi:MAG: sulfatase-like hydrolase/transferase [Planctomycetota bacterium]
MNLLRVNRPQRGARTVLASLLGVVLLLPSLSAQQRNVLLIIADDVGVDLIGAYGEHPDPANTPQLDALAQSGILFRNAWSMPSCSPTRSSILTGRYPYQTGIGRAIWPPTDQVELALAEQSIPELLGPAWNTAAIGKWHMHADQISGLQHPLLQGFDHHWGPAWNLPDSSPNSYYFYDKVVDGVNVYTTNYATTETVNDALLVIDEFGDEQPWFVWLAFNTSHTPWHTPPTSLQNYSCPHNPEDDKPEVGRAMTMAMDSEIGRLLAQMDPAVLAETVVIFVGDNGTHKDATTPPFDKDHAKATIYEGGINVPLIIAGAGVAAGAESAALVDITDIFATVLDLGGVPVPPGLHCVSMVPYFTDPLQPSLRSWVFSERFIPNGFGPYVSHQRAARNFRYKLVQDLGKNREIVDQDLYDLVLDPWETDDLLNGTQLVHSAQASYDTLSAVLGALVPPWKDLGQDLWGSQGTPDLYTGGTLLGGDTVTLELEDAALNSTAWLIVGFDQADLPFKGGVMVPDPLSPGLLLAFATGPAGEVALAFPWPREIPPGFQLFLQYWIQDPGMPNGWAASNGVQLTTP